MSETYTISVECNNCFGKIFNCIPKGTKVLDYIRKKKCDNCGCSLI